ncbi:ABC transporter permease [Candidatus Foliamicus sp.]
MKFHDLLLMATRALFRHRLRACMMLLATSIGVASVLLLTALGEAGRLFVTGEFRVLGTELIVVQPGNPGTSGSSPFGFMGETPRDLTFRDVEVVRRVPGVVRAAPIMMGRLPVSWGGRERQTMVVGANHDYARIRKLELNAGTFFPRMDMDRISPVCVVGQVIVSELYRSTPALGSWLRLGESRCRVVGIIADSGQSIGINTGEIVVAPVGFMATVYNTEALTNILVEARSREAVPGVIEELTRRLIEQHYGMHDFVTITQDAVLSVFDGIFTAITAALGGIAGISLIVAGILIMNVMLVAVSQRTSEIGLYMAIGAARRQIMRLFVSEAAILAAMGSACGLLFGYLLIGLARQAFPSLDFRPPWWAVAAAIVTAVASGLIFGALPARKAARMDPVQALRGRL